MVRNKMSVIIVGNGTSVLDIKNGPLIDSFDNVVRFNSFKIKGHEEYTGVKTNTWFTCNGHHINKIDSFDRVITHSWQWDKDKCKLYARLLKKRECEKTTREFVRKIPCKSPSTGLIAILFFLEEYDSITITGFDWWDRTNHHYGDREARGTMHKPKEEYELIKRLESENKLSFLERD